MPPPASQPPPTPSSSAISDLATISVTSRIPEFWTDQPRLWFTQFETVMQPQKQGDETKYALVIAKLNREALQQVSDLLLSPPTQDKYETLKTRLLTVFEESETKQFQKLLSEMDLGDQRPSQLLRRMRELARNRVPDDTLRILWSSRLPISIRGVLSVCNENELEKLAIIADKIHENTQSVEISAVGQTLTNHTDPHIAELATKIDNLSMEVSTLRYMFNNRRSRSPGYQTRSQSRSGFHKSQTRDTNRLCKYHFRFREQARRCESPCAWKPTIRALNAQGLYSDLVNKYPDILKPLDNKEPMKHDTVHHIISTGGPIHCKARPIRSDIYHKVKKEIEQMVDLGICRPSNSPWCSPLHVVKKKNGELRLCGDYRRLNAITTPDRYGIPRVHNFTNILHGKKIFSRIDLQKAYHHLPVYEVEKTAITTPFGPYEFPRMPFGLRNAGQTFQRFINSVLQGLDVFCFVDDVFCPSVSHKQNRKLLEEIFQRFQKYGIRINLPKCEFGKTEIDFLGYRITKDGIKPHPDRVKIITEYPKPNTVQELYVDSWEC
ncbi:uncharacterized protein LOC142985904 [Anticarsia gemmatalis]|uniref:uncharacterized protein LOC142985904 n=1 Tax=Anticarsia gemmatalis TaxID=129554 RepID=UPI003F763715